VAANVLRGLPSGGAGNSLATSDKFTLLALPLIRVIAPLAANRLVSRSLFCRPLLSALIFVASVSLFISRFWFLFFCKSNTFLCFIQIFIQKN
jgi:hypothetical protein